MFDLLRFRSTVAHGFATISSPFDLLTSYQPWLTVTGACLLLSLADFLDPLLFGAPVLLEALSPPFDLDRR